MKDIYDLIARIFIGGVFIYEALDSFFDYDQTKETMTAYGFNWSQDFFVVASIVFLVIGATMVLIGYYANYGAFFLLVYWLTYTFFVYSFWNDPVEMQRGNGLKFFHNLALCGGLLLLMANGSGKYSVKRLLYVLRLPK